MPIPDFSAMPMACLTRLAYSQHRDAPAAYDEMERRFAAGYLANRHVETVARLVGAAR